MISSYERGWPIEYHNRQWIYSDTREPINGKRTCRRCGRAPTDEGHDACLGTIVGMKSACCGHGVQAPIRMSNQAGRGKGAK